MDSDQLLEIGRIGKPHGLRGELIVALTSNVEDRIKTGTEIYLKSKKKYVVSDFVCPLEEQFKIFKPKFSILYSYFFLPPFIFSMNSLAGLGLKKCLKIEASVKPFLLATSKYFFASAKLLSSI